MNTETYSRRTATCLPVATTRYLFVDTDLPSQVDWTGVDRWTTHIGCFFDTLATGPCVILYTSATLDVIVYNQPSRSILNFKNDKRAHLAMGSLNRMDVLEGTWSFFNVCIFYLFDSLNTMEIVRHGKSGTKTWYLRELTHGGGNRRHCPEGISELVE